MRLVGRRPRLTGSPRRAFPARTTFMAWKFKQLVLLCYGTTGSLSIASHVFWFISPCGQPVRNTQRRAPKDKSSQGRLVDLLDGRAVVAVAATRSAAEAAARHAAAGHAAGHATLGTSTGAVELHHDGVRDALELLLL